MGCSKNEPSKNYYKFKQSSDELIEYLKKNMVNFFAIIKKMKQINYQAYKRGDTNYMDKNG